MTSTITDSSSVKLPVVEASDQSQLLGKQISLAAIQRQHEILLQEAVRNGRELAEKIRLGESGFLNEIYELLADIKSLAENAESFDEYRWLSDAAIKWQVVFSSTLNLPRSVQLALPRRLLPPQHQLMSVKALTEEEVEHWLSRNAEYFAFVRISGSHRLAGAWSTTTEREQDAHLARVFLASDILDGKINFASRIAPTSFWRLEETWLEDVKQLRAYFLWESRGQGFDPTKRDEDYFGACDGLRAMLLNPGIKAQPIEFAATRKYIEDRYLTNGLPLYTKEEAFKLIARKAQRIAEVTGQNDAAANWFNAEKYVMMFYGSILPAVLENNPEKVLMVLKAFQFSRSAKNYWWAINAFEAALVIYFVSAETIRLLWDASANKPMPDSSFESAVEVEDWPVFDIPAICKNGLDSNEVSFAYDGKRITFRGVMTEDQLRSLRAQVSNEVHLQKLQELFSQSRVIHENSTL